MRREQFCKPGSILIEYQEHREGPSPVFVAWRPNSSQTFTDKKALLKFAAWPRSTPTGIELRNCWQNLMRLRRQSKIKKNQPTTPRQSSNGKNLSS